VSLLSQFADFFGRDCYLLCSRWAMHLGFAFFVIENLSLG
jgi:hypothetical protein